MTSESQNDSDNLGDIGTLVMEDKPDLKEPPMYQVVLLNDDFTTMEFVVYIIQSIFGYATLWALKLPVAPPNLAA